MDVALDHCLLLKKLPNKERKLIIKTNGLKAEAIRVQLELDLKYKFAVLENCENMAEAKTSMVMKNSCGNGSYRAAQS